MMQFLRKFSYKASLVRAVALATAGSGIFCYTAPSDYDASISVSIPSHFRTSLTWPRGTNEKNNHHFVFTRPNPSQYGVIPLSFSKPDAIPDPGISKGAAIDAEDSPKPSCNSCNCLGRDTIANAAAKIGPSVVNLSVPQSFHGMTVGKSIGSGTIIDKDGTILTCAHVVVDFQGLRTSSKGKVEVTLQDGRSFEGTVVNADLHSDIAIVKIKSKTPLPAAKLGNSRKLRPGDWVLAMGCPLTLQNTITAGIVSCVDRKSSDLGLGGMHREYLQTDCAINQINVCDGCCFAYLLVAVLHCVCSKEDIEHVEHYLGFDLLQPKPILLCIVMNDGFIMDVPFFQGNSGGPLVNVDGEVVGVNIMKVLGADGLNFAVPIDSVSKIVEHFKRNGRVVRPWLGLKMLDLNHMIIDHLKEKNVSFPDVSKGVLIPVVSPGSPADRAGFHPGDVLVEFGGKPVGSIKEVIEAMGDKVGKPLRAVVKRANNVTEILTVTPEEANPDM
ncbi:serine protease htra2 [Striga asiatica]|uniref:Serine protease htra2 n=1 Tax=Striga asiatica TaxID=4170 RepID=A0A5A7REM5_STRAF|nr:serine protease htra2 [Striga asiatica]